MSLLKDRSKNTTNAKDMLPNYKSTGTIKAIY